MPEGNKSEIKKIEATGPCRKIMGDHFLELGAAVKSGKQKIAWCTSVGPAELLRGMGFLVYFPENHGAMLGATHMAMELIPAANAIGYSPDICSYLTADIGSYLKKQTPLTRAYKMDGPPKPDVLVFNTNQCRDVQDWFNWFGREFDAPVLGVHTHRDIGPIRNYQVKDIAKQIEDLIPKLEEVSGSKFDMDRFKEVVALSHETSELWRACLESASAAPSPWSFFDATILMGPAVVARGTQEAVDFYKILIAELNDRVNKGIAATEGEKHRIYWDGMPIWGKLRPMSDQFALLKTCVVASTYCNSWIFDQLDPNAPFESMARAYTELFIVRDEAYKEQYIKYAFDLYKFDGVIYHDAKTCPNNSNNRYGMPDRLIQKLGIPALTINGDLNDLRCYSEEQTTTNIEAFIEQLEE